MIGSHPVLRESNSALIHKLLPNCSWIAWRRCEKHQGVAHPKKEATKKESCGTKLETRSERWVKRARRDMYTQIYIYIYTEICMTLYHTHIANDHVLTTKTRQYLPKTWPNVLYQIENLNEYQLNNIFYLGINSPN